MIVDLSPNELAYLEACVDVAHNEGGPWGLGAKLSTDREAELFNKMGWVYTSPATEPYHPTVYPTVKRIFDLMCLEHTRDGRIVYLPGLISGLRIDEAVSILKRFPNSFVSLKEDMELLSVEMYRE